MESADRADHDQRPAPVGQRRTHRTRTVHQRIEIDLHHRVPALARELLAVVAHRALAQHHHIETLRQIERGKCARSRDVYAVVDEVCEIAAILYAVIACRGARAGDMYGGAALAKPMRNAIADTARPADDENGLTCEIKRIGHGKRSFRSTG